MELKLLIFIVLAVTTAAGFTFADVLPQMEVLLRFFQGSP